MSPTCTLDKDETGKPVDETNYRGMIGSLLYLNASRPDIMFSICRCARFQAAPKESHLTALKRIIRYLHGTTNYGLWYPNSNNFTLEVFSDADFASDKEDRKSTSGTCQLLGKSLISWNSKKQGLVSLSTTKAEYIAVGQCCTQLIWMSYQLSDYDLFFKPIKIFCDNSSAICLSKNHVHHSRAKHIDIKHHFIINYVAQGDFEIVFVYTENQLVDIFTKPLLEERFCMLRKSLGIIDQSV
ncbi:secreted RxLR effector protein 161-like [Lycium barbarum]|uniref:secreted RxLR effector protein 161-like n=1 Tax=Lycium barbarum TaxID=112863 RepID=UPI00293EFE5E|nr:secreted RxLR effector protein 161-like [Lycium barbarum]